MAKLSVYNTIDRSQLGGKFVPLIQSGVSNYKILASDLGKEYHPGDAIDITDTGEINVKFKPYDFDVSSEGLTIKTDESRGVFKGSDGVYIASADSTINVSVSGIKVNRSNLVSRISGAGLKAVGEMIDVNPADDTIDVGMYGIRVNTSALPIPNAHSLAGSGLESADSNTLYVKSANGTITVGSDGIKVNTSFLAGSYLRSDSNHGITVDTAPLAHAITGSGLVETNGLIGVNVNTATGIVVNDNKLYLNAGNGLQTTNNTVNVKAADNTINVSYSGVSVNKSALSIPTAPSLAGLGLGTSDGMQLDVKVADNTIDISEYGIKVNRSAMPTAYSLAGNGLVANGDRLYVKPAGHTISVHSDGVGIRLKPDCYLYKHSKGLAFDSGTLFYYLQSGSGLTSNSNSYVDVHIGSGLSFSSSGAIDVVNGHGLRVHNGGLSVKSADHSILVGHSGIKVNSNSIAGHGLRADMSGNNKIHINTGSGLDVSNDLLYVQPADNTITVGPDGIRVNTSALPIPNAHSLAGLGLTSRGSYLSVQSADNTIDISEYGIKVNRSAMPTAYSLAGSGLISRGSYLYVQSADNTIDISEYGIKVNASSGLETTSSGLYVKSADDTITVGSDGIKVNTSALPAKIPEPGRGIAGSSSSYYLHSSKGTITIGSDYIDVNPSALAGAGLSTDAGKLYVQSADGTIGVTSSGIGVNVTSGGGLLTGVHGLYIDSAKLAGSGLKASHIEQHNVKLSVNVGLYDLSSNNNSSNLLKLDTATNALYVSGVGVTGIIGTNSTMTREQDSSSYYHSFGVDVDYLFSVYTDSNTLTYSGNKLGVHLSSIAGDGLGYNPTNKSIYVSSGGSGGSIVGVAVSTPNKQHAYASAAGSIAVGESAWTGGDNSIAIGRFTHLTSDSLEAVAIGYVASAMGVRAIAIGSESYVYSSSAIAIGYDSTVKGPNSIAIGSNSYVNSSSTIAIGYYSASGAYSVAIGAGSSAPDTYCLSAGYKSSATGPESVALGVNSNASSFGIAIGSQSNASQYGLAIGYNASALNGMASISTSHSDGRCFDYKYDCEGKLYATDTSGGTYTRSWENLLTPPDYRTAVSINANTEYTADKPAYIAFNVHAGGTSGYEVAFIKNSVTVFNIGILYGLTVYNIIPVSKGDTYKLQVTDHGATNPQIYAYRIYPQ